MGLSRRRVPLCEKCLTAPGTGPMIRLRSRKQGERSYAPVSLLHPPGRFACRCDGRLGGHCQVICWDGEYF